MAKKIVNGKNVTNIDNYDEFLLERRKLMAAKMKDYYYSL